jgi:hypothetical protein
MTEIQNNDEIEKLNNEISNNEQLEETSNINSNETIEFINECNTSIFDFTKDKTNNIILKPKVKNIKKKYRLYQYNLYIENYVYIDKFATFSDISNYLENKDININLKTLLKNKLLKIELII